MDIKRGGSQPSGKKQAEYFTGNVRIDALDKADEPSLIAGDDTALKLPRRMTHVSYSISYTK